MSYRDLAGFGRRFIDVAAVAAATQLVDATPPVLGLAGSAFFDEAARLGLRTVAEAFADRAYRPDGQLVSRHAPGAVLHDPAVVAQRVVTMVATGQVTAVDGTQLAVIVESVCLHGDSPDAVQMAAAVRDQLNAADVDIRAFC